MRRLIYFFILVSMLSSCNKEESDFLWEKSYGTGTARFIRASADSGFFACGEKGGNPYFVRLDNSRKLVIDFENDNPGSFTSAWFDTAGYITGGFSGNKMLLNRYDNEGVKVWEKILDPGFNIGYTKLLYRGDGNFLALGSTSADSEISVPSGVLLVLFDTTGVVMSQDEISDGSFLAASDAVLDDEGNIFLALTRQASGAKSRASVARYNNALQKQWETALFNNPSFGGAAMAVKLDNAGDVYVAGRTELNDGDGLLYNSFVSSVSGSGSLNWNKYLESSNSGSSVDLDDNNSLLMLNRNCFIINFLEPSDGADAGILRPFDLCDSYNTDALSSDMDFNYDKNYLLAGTRGDNFYLALKQAK